MTIKSIGLTVISLLALTTAAHAAEVTGFRSATFGSSEKAVMDAAAKDLGVKTSDIKKQEDPVSQITQLTASVKSFAPLNLPAQVSYVLGYQCKCLTQVAVAWTFPDDITAEQRKQAMTGLAALVGHFEQQSWGKDEVIQNRIPGEVKEKGENAIVFFRGQNKGKSAITVAGGPVKMEKQAKAEALSANVDALKSVVVSYEKDATNPDVYHVDVSGF